MKVEEVVGIAGVFGSKNTMLHVGVDLTFDIPLISMSAGMKMIVERELHNAVTRMLEKASKP